MDITISDILIGISIALIVIVLYNKCTEKFTSKREKANHLTDWWNSNSSPTYKRFKRENPKSDAVEYYNIKKLPEVTVDKVEEVLS